MKKYFKKNLLALFMVLVVVATTACAAEEPTEATATPATPAASSEPSAEAVTDPEELVAEEGAVIKFTYWEGSESDAAAWEAVLSKFQVDHPEITLEAEAFPSKTYVSQLDTMIAGGTWPDVMRYTYQRLGKFKEAEVMLELDQLADPAIVNDMLPAFKEACSYNGKLVAMPHHTDTIAVFYNKAMFAESGIRIPTSPEDAWTWDEMNEIARKLKTDHGLPYAFAGIWENKSGYRYLPFVYMNGGSLLNDDGTELAIDSPEFLEAIQLYEGWVKEGLVANTGFTQEQQCNSLFVAEQTAFAFAGSWHTSYMEENMPGKWGVTYMPQVEGKTSSDLGGNGLFAYKDTKYPNACAIFMNYITSEENMQLFCETGNFIPVSKSLSEKELVYSAFPAEMKIFKEISATVDPKMAKDETSSRFQALNVVFSEQMDNLIIGGESSETVIQNMQTEMQAILDE